MRPPAKEVSFLNLKNMSVNTSRGRDLLIYIKSDTSADMPIDAYKAVLCKIEDLEQDLTYRGASTTVKTGETLITGTSRTAAYEFDFEINESTGLYKYTYKGRLILADDTDTEVDGEGGGSLPELPEPPAPPAPPNLEGLLGGEEGFPDSPPPDPEF